MEHQKNNSQGVCSEKIHRKSCSTGCDQATHMAVLLPSVHPLLQYLPHLHTFHLTDVPRCLPQPQLMIVGTLTRVVYPRGREAHARLLVSLVTEEPT